jgi:hypothetical protein
MRALTLVDLFARADHNTGHTKPSAVQLQPIDFNASSIENGVAADNRMITI